jgi:sulfotransferase family protein
MEHPQVYMSSPFKEPHFFAFEGEKPNFQGPGDQELYNHIVFSNIEAYRALFQGVSKETAIGEASVNYLYVSRAPDRIRHYVPDMKLIAVLRNPTERAYSAFLHMTRDCREPLSDFARALEAEEERIQNDWAPVWHYKQAGFYYTLLKRYYETFEREQIRIYLYEDLNNDVSGVLKDIYRFLGVDVNFVADVSTRYNVSGVPERWRPLHAFLIRSNPVKSLVKPLLPEGLRRRLVPLVLNPLQERTLVRPPLPVEVRRQLTELYKEDVLKLQELIGRDLSKWLQYSESDSKGQKLPARGIYRH